MKLMQDLSAQFVKVISNVTVFEKLQLVYPNIIYELAILFHKSSAKIANSYLQAFLSLLSLSTILSLSSFISTHFSFALARRAH